MIKDLLRYVSYILSIAVPTCITSILVSKVGTGGGAIFPALLTFFVPFGIGAGLARAVWRNLWLEVLVLAALIGITIHGFRGVYSAFYRVPARGGIDLIFRPYEQTYFMVGVAVVVGAIWLLTKGKARKAKDIGSE